MSNKPKHDTYIICTRCGKELKTLGDQHDCRGIAPVIIEVEPKSWGVCPRCGAELHCMNCTSIMDCAKCKSQIEQEMARKIWVELSREIDERVKILLKGLHTDSTLKFESWWQQLKERYEVK